MSFTSWLALLVLIDSGVEVKDKRIGRGVQWLLANQREPGRRWTRSRSTDMFTSRTTPTPMLGH